MFKLFVSTSAEGDYSLTELGSGCLIFLLVTIVVIAVIAAQKHNTTKLTAKQLTFSGLAMALALVTSNIKLYSFPFGGSVTLFSMLFICLIGYMYGPRISIPAAIAYGILQFVIEPYIYHPAQILLDYLLAYGALGLSGLFRKQKYGLIKGYVVGILGRFIFSSLSGYIFFAEYAPKGWNPVVYTIAYNGAYIATEGIATIILLSIPVVAGAFLQVKKAANQA